MRRFLYAILLYGYLADNSASWLSFRGCLECYDQRQRIARGEF